MENNITKYVNECLDCKNPTCIEGCPVHNNIPLFFILYCINTYLKLCRNFYV